ncbi:MAG: dihydrodipicolinate synthase family protein [Bacteroidetes bacterium]|nr:dihydrodipicolinate synthase family protein [Bacteroidota bacterium]
MEDGPLFSGIYPALVSPVAKDGSVMEPELRALVRHFADTPVNGLYVCGGTGEGVLLPVRTRKRIVDIVIDESGKAQREHPLQILVHIGATEPANTEELVLHADAAGADALSAIPPIYFSYSRDQVCEYYSWIAQLSTLPLIIYASAQSGTAFTADMLKELSKQPTIKGIKFTGYNFYELMNMRSVVPDNFSILNGGDEVMMFGLLAGVNGGIGATYNVMPTQFCRLYDAWAAGDIELVKSIQRKINNIISLIVQFPVIGAVKHMLQEQGFSVGNTIFPNNPLSPDQKVELTAKLEAIAWREVCI